MNKRILLSVMVIGAVLASVSGATIAYFSNTETSTDNYFTAGTINISVDGDSPWNNVGHFTIEDMKPSTVHYREVILENIGVNTADIWKKLVVTGYTDNLHPDSEDGEDPSGNVNNIGSVIRYDMTINDQVFIEEADNYVLDESAYQLPNTWHANGRYIYLGRLEPGATMKVVQSYHMDGSVTNWAQGDQMALDVEFYAQQTSGGAAVPGTELPGREREGTELDSINIGDSMDMAAHNAAGWMTDPAIGNYGGRDGGSTIAMTWGDGVCDAGDQAATFELDAHGETVTKLVVRYLAGITDDSFNAYVDGALVGTCNDVTDSSETWHTTEFPVSFSGKATIKLEPVNGPWGNCGTYGQGAFNWAKITN